ncbi:MAG: hypothetical protein ACI30R_01910 [Sodaliphilus sp.]
MKRKLFTPLLCLLVMAIMAGCNLEKSKIALEVKQINDECPKSLGNGMTLTSVELEDDFMVYTVSVDAETFKDVAENAKSPLASKLFSLMIIEDLDADEKQTLLEAKVGIKYVYNCTTGESRTLTVSSQEFADAVKHPLKGKDLLDLQISILKGRLPMDIGEGMTMVDAAIKARTLSCVIDVTSAGIDMAELIANAANIQASDMFTKDDIESDPLLLTAIEQGFDIEYVYTQTNSPLTATTVIPNRDLKAIIY